jgi:hypothetical protein
MAEFEHEVAVAKLEHESALAEALEVPRPDIQMLSEAAKLEHESALAEAMEVPRRKIPMLSEAELEAMMRPMELDARVGRKMADGRAAIASLRRLRRDYIDREDCRQDHDPAHRLPPDRAKYDC